MFAQPQQEYGSNMSRETSLCLLITTKKQTPISYSIAYLRYIQTQPDLFALLLEWLKQRCYLPTMSLPNHQVTAIAITCLYFCIKQHELSKIEQASQVYGFKSQDEKWLKIGVNKVHQLGGKLEQQYEVFVGILEELEAAS